ncbi:hypothetical protein GCM10023082_66520 [Streptomyces tremellae]|uniref:Uncharacterized protein n=1 Tax=Streptomyces tremellae TaxID=1124239 RepID=A0ABP7GIJ9_9ACTN
MFEARRLLQHVDDVLHGDVLHGPRVGERRRGALHHARTDPAHLVEFEGGGGVGELLRGVPDDPDDAVGAPAAVPAQGALGVVKRREPSRRLTRK